MNNFFFKKLNVSPTVKKELVKACDTVYQCILDTEPLTGSNIMFWQVNEMYPIITDMSSNTTPLRKCSWNYLLQQDIITNEFLNKFKLENVHSAVQATNFNHHRHRASYQNEYRPYQLVINYCNAKFEFINPTNLSDDYMYSDHSIDDLPQGATFDVLIDEDCAHLDICLFNSWSFHTFKSSEPARAAIWIPSVKDVNEAEEYVSYIESLA